MWNIAVVSKTNKDDIKWFVNGYDGRPLRFIEYGTAEREALYMNNGTAGAIFLEDDLEYRVILEQKEAWYDN